MTACKTQHKSRPEDPPQVITESRPRFFRNRLMKPLPRPPTVVRGACVVRTNPCLKATASGDKGAFGDARVMRTWGLHWDWSRISLVGRHACSALHGPRTTAHGPSLQRRKARLADGSPVTRLVLLQ